MQFLPQSIGAVSHLLCIGSPSDETSPEFQVDALSLYLAQLNAKYYYYATHSMHTKTLERVKKRAMPGEDNAQPAWRLAR